MKKLLFLALFTLNVFAQEHKQVFVSSDSLEVPISQTLANRSKTIRNLLDVSEGQSISLSEHDLRIPLDFAAADITLLQDILDNPGLLQGILYEPFLAMIQLWDFLDIQDTDSLNLNSLLESLFRTGNYKAGDLPDDLITRFKDKNSSLLWQDKAFKAKKISLKDLKVYSTDINIKHVSLSPNGRYVFFMAVDDCCNRDYFFFIMDLIEEKLVCNETGVTGIASPDGSILIKYNKALKTIDIIDTNTLEIIKQLTRENISHIYLPPVAVFYKDNVVKLLRGFKVGDCKVIVDSINFTTNEVKKTILIDSSESVTAGAFSADGSQVLLATWPVRTMMGNLLLKEIDSKKTLWETTSPIGSGDVVEEIITNGTCVAITKAPKSLYLRNMLNGENVSLSNLPPCAFASNNPIEFFYDTNAIVLVDVNAKKIIKKFSIRVWSFNKGIFANNTCVLQMDNENLMVHQLDVSLLRQKKQTKNRQKQ